MSEPVKAVATNFIRNIINEDLKHGKNGGRVHTRFPPEPNGYLHIGHAKAICLNFGIARDYQGLCNLRFDDTNPAKESEEFSRAIEEDLRWLGFEWHNTPYHASDYFEQLYKFAEELIEKGLAYVDEQDADAMRASRGTLTEPGTDSPYRDRPVAENLDLFRRMRAGEFEDGSMVLRARIDMASSNLNMRDPVIYRIRRQHHIRTKDAWVIYPMYDFTHGISDALEGITHSLCTLEFEDHRPLYNWFLDNITIDCHPQQIEFARLSLAYTITSKRKLSQLVTEGLVSGWDDPRMPTLTGIRRRGFTPRAIRRFCDLIGVTKKNTVTDMSILEDCVRQDLDAHAPRAMAVLDPVKVVIENYPEGKVEMLEAPRHPKTDLGTRELPMTREIYIDRADFRESANKKFKRMVLEGEVRLRNGYVIKCLQAIKDDEGNITELRCSYDPETLGVNPEGRKVRGVIHWVSASHSLPAQVRLYDRLFKESNPGSLSDFHEAINPESLRILDNCRVEASLGEVQPEQQFQFEREGYFCADRHDCKPGHLVFNRSVSLRDSWAKLDQGA